MSGVCRRRRWQLGLDRPLRYAETFEDRTLLDGVPTFVSVPTPFSVIETANSGVEFGTIGATDPDGDSLTYTIPPADPNNPGDPNDPAILFSIDATGPNGETGKYKVNGLLDFETTPSYSFDIEVSDGILTVLATVTVNVTDVPESPEFGQDTYTFSVDENANEFPAGGASIVATDPQNDFLTYDIVASDPNSRWEAAMLPGLWRTHGENTWIKKRGINRITTFIPRSIE